MPAKLYGPITGSSWTDVPQPFHALLIGTSLFDPLVAVSNAAKRADRFANSVAERADHIAKARRAAAVGSGARCRCRWLAPPA
jgi:hypothetical protein